MPYLYNAISSKSIYLDVAEGDKTARILRSEAEMQEQAWFFVIGFTNDYYFYQTF